MERWAGRHGFGFYLGFWALIGMGRPVSANPSIGISALVAGSLLGETTLPSAQQISNQRNYNYCTLYALASFLELWGTSRRNDGRRLPTIDPGYLAAATNWELGTTNNGLALQATLPILQRWGAIPTDSTLPRGSSLTWPLANWSETHASLIPAATVEGLLDSSYRHSSVVSAFNGREYLAQEIGLDPRSLIAVYTTRTETLRPSTTTGTTSEDYYREGSYENGINYLGRLATSQQVTMTSDSLHPDPLYTLTVVQLYQRHPVLISVNTGLAKERFSNYRTIGTSDLEEEGNGRNGLHAMVAVAHCDRSNSRRAPCRDYAADMTAKSITECLVVQNSWGTGVNNRGYVCISRRAAERMLQGSVLLKEIVNP